VPLRYLLLQGCYADALAAARVTDVAGVHTRWCVLGAPDVSVLAAARSRCVGLDAELMPLPLRGSSAWPGYTPAGVYCGRGTHPLVCTGGARRLCPCRCEDQVRRAGCHADALAAARVTGVAGVHTRRCVRGRPGRLTGHVDVKKK
jgi:hypothetical protein